MRFAVKDKQIKSQKIGSTANASALIAIMATSQLNIVLSIVLRFMSPHPPPPIPLPLLQSRALHGPLGSPSPRVRQGDL